MLKFRKGGVHIIYKTCTRCRKRMEYSKKCNCYDKFKVNSDKYKSKKEKTFYKSKDWQNIAKLVKNRLNHIDLYSYYMLGVIENGEVVHHIEPIKDNWDKRLSLSNLIYLTEKNHRTIHNLMKKSTEEKERVQNLLKDLLTKFYSN